MRIVNLPLPLLLAAALGCEGPAGPAGVSGTAGQPGGSCSVTDNLDGTVTVQCADGTSVTVSDGAAGSSCSVADNLDGTKTITCDDGTSVTVSDGVAAQPCSVTSNTDGSSTISCADGSTATVASGANGSSCSVSTAADGTKTINCTDGTSATVSDGADGMNVRVLSLHGTDHLLSEGEFALPVNPKLFVTATITAAAADANGLVTVDFTVEDQAGQPLPGVASISANIVKLAPASGGESFNKWVPYIYSKAEVTTAGDWPNPIGTVAYQASRESSGTGAGKGTLVDHGDGSYTYTFAKDLDAAPAAGFPVVSYERNLLHRVAIYMGGHSGPTADAWYDFVPDGTAVSERRDIVSTAACQQCHGWEFHGHGGDRLSTETCVTCHVADTVDPNGGESLDMKTMIHKIHAGAELPRIPGADGVVWDNPATTADESADNGEYAIWGYRNTKYEWWKVEFPAVIENCTKCHQGSGAQADNWKNEPSRDACGSCHEIDLTDTTLHPGAVGSSDDSMCAMCHTLGGMAGAVDVAHDWTDNDARNVPEFIAELALTPPANGTHYVAGEAPIVSIKLADNEVAGNPYIDFTATPPLEDAAAPTGDGLEGCAATGCATGRDGKFANFALFVHGPRGNRNPVLTTTARARILATSAGPWDLSASGASLILRVDGGGTALYDPSGAGGDATNRSGDITANVSTGTAANSCGTGVKCIASAAAATATEVMNWLNANSAFRTRAIAYLDEVTGNLAIRSKNLGQVDSIQLLTSAVNTAVFGGSTTVNNIAVSTASNQLSVRIDPTKQDPKVSYAGTEVRYQLDPVDNLAPGTYVVGVEITDRGRISDTNYKTPTVAFLTFQVGQPDEELPVARNCDSCHWNNTDNRGFILDFGRHNKLFTDLALDQCGSCHDYQPQTPAGATPVASWSGAKPISKRVHAIHSGASLSYPLATVDYSGGDPVKGRNWDITFPQDARNCQQCHPDATTSGSWTEASRLPCWGCHDSDASQGHIRSMTFDPTPADPWSGDEIEACRTCH